MKSERRQKIDFYIYLLNKIFSLFISLLCNLSSEEFGFLLGGFETTVTQFGGSIDEFKGDLLKSDFREF